MEDPQVLLGMHLELGRRANFVVEERVIMDKLGRETNRRLFFKRALAVGEAASLDLPEVELLPQARFVTPPSTVGAMWHPWRALRQLAHVDLHWRPMDGVLGFTYALDRILASRRGNVAARWLTSSSTSSAATTVA